ncbi:MAG: ATP-binding protein [Gemmatimonadales bacterium]
MPLAPLYGHEGLKDRLEGAVASGRLPQSLLLVGPPGVGKQRLGLWLTQTLLCTSRNTGPCGVCEHCRRVADLAHPDLHWFVPLEPPKRPLDEAKKVEWAEGALAEVMATRRQAPLYQRPSGMASHSMASVRLLLRRVLMRPALGRAKVMLVGDAERLIVQEASPEAANALLKALEEPPSDTYVVLTAADPEALLPTIRSRMVTIRVPGLPDSVVTAFLQREMKPALSAQELERRVAAADGSIGCAIAGSRPGDRVRPLGLGKAREPADRYERALAQAPWSARGEFTDLLDAMLLEARSAARARPGRGTIRAVEVLLETRGLAQGNVNPQLLLARALDQLAEVA